MKRILIILFAIAVSLYLMPAIAQSAGDDVKARLKEVREKKARAIIDCDSEIAAAGKEFEGRMAKIKADYRIAHNQCMEEKRKKDREVRQRYDDEIRRLSKEEDELAQSVGAGESSNFAQIKAGE